MGIKHCHLQLKLVKHSVENFIITEGERGGINIHQNHFWKEREVLIMGYLIQIQLICGE